MTLTTEQQKKLLIGLLAVFIAVFLYRVLTAEKQATAPLAFPRGSVATSPVRAVAAAAAGDPLQVLLGRREEKYPGVVRDLFRMENPVQRPKTVAGGPAAGAGTAGGEQTAPPPPQKTAEEIAAEAARADLSKFRFLGYVSERSAGESSLFLSKEGELFIVKSGDKVLKNYMVKATGKDYVVLFDTITRVEVRIELSGGEDQQSKQPPGRMPPPHAP